MTVDSFPKNKTVVFENRSSVASLTATEWILTHGRINDPVLPVPKIEPIGIVTRSTFKPIVAGPACQCIGRPLADKHLSAHKHIVTKPTCQDIVASVSNELHRADGGSGGERIIPIRSSRVLKIGRSKVKSDAEDALESDRIDTGSAVSDRVIRVGDDNIIAGTAEQLVGSLAAVQLVVPGPTIEHVVAGFTFQRIIPVLAVQHIVAIPSLYDITADATEELITPPVTKHDVSALPAVDHIVDVPSGQEIIPVEAIEGAVDLATV